MNFLADIHLHSRWSRATSPDLTPENLHMWSMRKGISVVGSGDFTHPAWYAELGEKLVPAEEGLYRLRPDLLDRVEEQVPTSCRREVRFLLSVEISSIYKKNGRTRKVHNVVCLPSLAHVERLNRRLAAIGNLAADGRPILGLDCRDLLEICLDVCPDVLFIPAHIWTPHFAVLGARSGFDSLEECFADLLPHIFAIETGLSSDPLMNSRLSALDRYSVGSNSDAHSAPKLGREATCFNTDLSYAAIYDALKSGDPERFTGTIEFYPEEGKYHLDGHRKCGVRLTPQQTIAAAGRCPACGGELTVGVLHRVESLADREPHEAAPLAGAFETLIPLVEVIGACVGVGPKSKKVQGIYHHLLQDLGPELEILRHVDVSRIAQCGHPLVAEGVRRMRSGRIAITPGYDGLYGVIQAVTVAERRQLQGRAITPADVTAAAVVERLATDNNGRRVDQLLATAQALGTDAELDEQQQQVVCAAGPVAVLGGPGSGKTLSLTQRIAWLVEQGGVVPEQIAVVSLSERAARQVRQRLDVLLGNRGALVVVGTIQHLVQQLQQNPAAAENRPIVV
ncbi:MAG: AAA family ATPase, partial [Gemmatimonadetes bacterium]|nr:AAA family ATPase [Gemmatimonadota bacterium]